MKNIIIIGSGLSGISAAYEFKKNNIDVIILDKARNAGGRICSKISSDYCFNHGAQYLTAYSTFFSDILSLGYSQGKLKKWKIQPNKYVYVGNPNMRSFMNWISKDFDIRKNIEVKKISYNKLSKKFDIFSDDFHFTSDGVLLTPPAPQTSKLIKNLDNYLYEEINKVKFWPCWCVMLKFYKEVNFKFYRDKNNIISYAVSENYKLNNEKNNLITIHASEDFSYKNVDSKKEIVENKLIKTFIENHKINLKDIELIKSHRWLYSKVKKKTNAETPFTSKLFPLGIAGDWHPGYNECKNRGHGVRSEDAFLSGLTSAKLMIKNFIK